MSIGADRQLHLAALALVLVAGIGSGCRPAGETRMIDGAPRPAAGQSAQADEATHDQKKVAAEEADSTLQRAEENYPPEGGPYEAYNRQVTVAYRNWVEAERTYLGPNWEGPYLATKRVDLDDCGAYAKAGVPGAACAVMAANPPAIPTLESLLLPRHSYDETHSTAPTGAIADSSPAPSDNPGSATPPTDLSTPRG